ncbi:MAG: hypothetical protein ACLF0G_10715 [Candidatus Brocadiia bacterium]
MAQPSAPQPPDGGPRELSGPLPRRARPRTGRTVETLRGPMLRWSSGVRPVGRAGRLSLQEQLVDDLARLRETSFDLDRKLGAPAGDPSRDVAQEDLREMQDRARRMSRTVAQDADYGAVARAADLLCLTLEHASLDHLDASRLDALRRAIRLMERPGFGAQQFREVQQLLSPPEEPSR